MPPITTLPGKTPFDFRQVQQMTNSITGLFQTVENQRVKNEERNIANIVSNVQPISADRTAKSPFQINQEIKSKINLSRTNRGKPGLFDIFDTSALPSGPTPTERALQQQGISSLFGAQKQQQATTQAAQKSRLVEAQIRASDALATQRRGETDKPTTIAGQNAIIKVGTDAINRIAQGQGSNIGEFLTSNSVASIGTAYQAILSSNAKSQDKQDAINSLIRSSGNQEEALQTKDMIDRGIDINSITSRYDSVAGRLGEQIREERFLTHLTKNNKDDLKMDFLREIKPQGNETFEDNLLAFKESIRDADVDKNVNKEEDKQSFKNLDFFEDEVFEGKLSFEDIKLEESLAKKSNEDDFQEALDVIQLRALMNMSNKEYKKWHDVSLKRLKESKDIDTELENISKEIK